MPKITIDGIQYDFNPGETIIQIATRNGVEIPHYCWHPRLSVSGNCRMCLVEVEKMPKLVIACATQAMDGMVVHTKSDKAIKAREHVMEFLLINHPLDCPICDEAGECKLQEYAYAHGTGESRFIEEKNHKPKRVKLGPYVMFDAERCISCSRCIRFSKEIAKADQLTFVQRGDRVTIETFPGKQFDNPYSLNVVDICPVGALTNADFRFKARVWEMSATKSICPGCARGCNIDIWVRNNEILRLTPRFNEKVNDYWMCDHGRINCFKFVNADDRIDGPFIKKENELVSVNWDEAVSKSTSELKRFKGNEIAVIASPFATLEDNYAVQKFAKQVLKTNNIFFIPHIKPGDQDDILIREDKTPNSTGLKLLGIEETKNGLNIETLAEKINSKSIKCLIVIEDDPISIKPELKNAFQNLDLLIVFATNQNKTTKLADVLFPAATYAEKNGVFVNFQGFVQRIRPAVATIDIDRSLDGLAQSRWDKFGTEFDKWARGRKVNARSTWKIVSQIANALGGRFDYDTSEDVFIEITQNVRELANLDYETLGDTGYQIKSSKIIEEKILV